MVTTRPPKTMVKPTALGPVANTDTKLLIYGLFQKGRVLAQDGIAVLKRKGSLVGGESGQVRKPGGGRKRIEEVAPAVERELKKILNGTTAGDPMSYLKWTNKSTRTMAAELERKGHDISHVTVGRCLREMGYSLQGNLKTIEGTQHPDRDKQFRYINKQVSKFMRSKDPVVSVDTKKKELDRSL